MPAGKRVEASIWTTRKALGGMQHSAASRTKEGHARIDLVGQAVGSC